MRRGFGRTEFSCSRYPSSSVCLGVFIERWMVERSTGGEGIMFSALRSRGTLPWISKWVL